MAWTGKGGGGWQDGGGPWGRGPGSTPPNSGPPRGGPPKGPPGGPQRPDMEELFRRWHERMRPIMEGRDPRGIMLLLSGVVLLWLASGAYFVDAGSRAIVTRFGAYHREVGEGPAYHLPYPFEKAVVLPVDAINKVAVGASQTLRRMTGSAENPVDDESLMLTGDENIVDVSFDVQWRISNAKDFLFKVKDAPELVKPVAESAMREVIGKSAFATAQTEGRFRIQDDAKKLMQKIFDEYHAGILVEAVNLQKVNAPPQVIDAFRDVQAAKQDEERLRNQAEAYRNDILPRARGQAERILQEANAYRQRTIADAQGNASRFLAIYKEYAQAKDVTRQRLYLETMEDVLHGMNKVIVDEGASRQGVLPYLPLQELRRAAPEEARPEEKKSEDKKPDDKKPEEKKP